MPLKHYSSNSFLPSASLPTGTLNVGKHENTRLIFEKNRFEGKKYTEIAEEQQISVKTVEAHISKALKILRVELKDYLPFLILLFQTPDKYI